MVWVQNKSCPTKDYGSKELTFQKIINKNKGEGNMATRPGGGDVERALRCNLAFQAALQDQLRSLLVVKGEVAKRIQRERDVLSKAARVDEERSKTSEERRYYHARVIDGKQDVPRSLLREGETWSHGGNRPYFFDPDAFEGLHFDFGGPGTTAGKGDSSAPSTGMTILEASGPRLKHTPRLQRQWVLRDGEHIQRFEPQAGIPKKQREAIDRSIKMAVEHYLLKKAAALRGVGVPPPMSISLLTLLKECPAPFTRQEWREIMQDDAVMGQTLEFCQRQWNFALDPRIRHGKWTRDEDKLLIALASKHKDSDWQQIALELTQAMTSKGPVSNQRTPLQCIERYQRSLNVKMVRHKWTSEEDEQLKKLVAEYGTPLHASDKARSSMDWLSISSKMANRTEAQCTTRYRNSLNPEIKRGRFNCEEDMQLLCSAELHGIPQQLPVGKKPKDVAAEQGATAPSSCPSSSSSTPEVQRPKRDSLPWSQVAALVPGRTDVQCRERYVNNLRYERENLARRVPWTAEEDFKLLGVVEDIGPGKWGEVCKRMHLRTDHECLKRWEVIASDANTEQFTASLVKKRLGLRQIFSNREKHRPELTTEDFCIEPAQGLPASSGGKQKMLAGIPAAKKAKKAKKKKSKKPRPTGNVQK
jgi:hypothetical protein